MAFFHQLRLLLWKNYTLKKRSPFILGLELIVPLVLFLILVSIRNHQPPLKRSALTWYPDALPSAGIIPLLQSFCTSGSVIGSDGYRHYPKASVYKILEDVGEVANTPVFNAVVDLKNLRDDFIKFNSDQMFSKHKRQIQDFKLTDVLIKNGTLLKTFLLNNLSMPQNLMTDLMKSTFNGSEVSTILLEKNENLLNSILHSIQIYGLPTSEEMKELQQSIIFQAMFDPTSLFKGATWLGLLATIGNVPGVRPSKINWKEVEDFFRKEYLNPVEIHNLSCSLQVFSKLLILPSGNRNDSHQLQAFLCNLNKTEVKTLTNELQLSFNWNLMTQRIRVVGPAMEEYMNRATKIRDDLTKLSNLEDAFMKLSKLAKDLHLNLTKVDSRKNKSRPHQLRLNANDMWNVLAPVLCGTQRNSKNEEERKETGNSIPEMLDGVGEPTRALKVMLYTLTHDPMILYSPNGTAADEVMNKSGHLLDLLKQTKKIGTKWLSMSQSFQSQLMLNKTQETLKDLLVSVDKFPFMYDKPFNISDDVLKHSPEKLREFLLEHNQTIKYYTNFTKAHIKNIINAMLTQADGQNPVVTQLKSIDYMVKGWKAVLAPMKLDIFYGFPNETAMLKYINNVTSSNKPQKPILSAVVFDNIKEDGSLPKHIFYRIRMDGRLLPATQDVRSSYWTPSPLVGRANYFYYGFAWMQDQLERAMIDVMTGTNVTSPGLYVQELPYPCYLSDDFMFVIQYIMPLCVVVSFIYSVAILVQCIVHEKEQRLKEVMKMMGLSNAVHWTSWFITSATTMILVVVLLTIVLKVGSILKNSNPFIILIFLLLAAVATINFCFLISIFFSKAKLAAACGGIIYFVTYMPYVFISIQERGIGHENIGFNFKTMASLFSTTAFGLGARYFALHEQNGIGVQWYNIASSPLENDTFNLAQVFKMLIVDTFLYAILVWYIEAIYPGVYGIPRPWYFPFQPSYWLGPNVNWSPDVDCVKPYRRVRGHSQTNIDQPNTPALLAVESEPIHLQLGVFIDNLVKVYKKGSPPAVDHLSLYLYESQITSFLGHNGAGKTTTMSLLTGLFPSTSGTAYIYGNDIHKDMDKIRRSLGLCPQHNVLYSKLTVEEHLWFYARLKGMPVKQVEEETNRILEDVGLPEKRKSFVDTLSGGMKRKLSVAMAFVGGSKTVILDEPTAGVDPFARRAIWELLAKYKEGRTILLSTHFMDEADILGDRIAIISHGKLRCCGSSLFLKTKFGDGYHLTLVKETKKDALNKISTEAITKFIKGFIPSAQKICETQYELSYILPDKGKERKGMLRKLFEGLEENKQQLGCKSFGLQDTTLEEVFLKVTEATVVGEDVDEPNELVGTIDETPPTVQSPSEEPLIPPLQSPTSPQTISSPLSDTDTITSIPAKFLIEKKPGHRRSFSTDLIDSKLHSRRHQAAPPVCAHRRTASGGFCGHRRSLSSDLTFSLTANDTNTPETIKKVSKHKRVPSGVAKMHAVGSEAWQCHAGGTKTVNANMRRWQQFYGLLIKRFHHSRRNIKGLLTHILLPGIFISIAMTVALSQPKDQLYPPLTLSPSMFHPPPYYIPFTNNKKGAFNMPERMENTLNLASGVGSDCVLRDSNMTFTHTMSVRDLRRNLSAYFDKFCSQQVGKQNEIPRPRRFVQNLTYSESRESCYCDRSQWHCDDTVERNTKEFTTVTLDTLINVTQKNFQKYLQNTNFMYKRRRYGALTFGDEQEAVPVQIKNSPHLEVRKLFLRDSARVWFSNRGFHAMPAFINAMDNAILRASITPEMGDPAAYGITAITHPLNVTKNVLNLDSIKQGTDTIIAIFVIIAMSFVPASFVVFLVMERTTKAKHIQFVSGVNPVLYWLSNYVWDFLNFLIPAMACMVIFHIFNVPAYASHTNFPAVCALFICYGWSITPMMYPASFLFKEASTAYVVLILMNLFLGITCTVTTSILQLFPNDPQLTMAFHVVRLGSLIFPNYCLGRGLMDLAYNELMNIVHVQIGQSEKVRSPFEWDIVLRSLVCMLSEGFLFFLITLLIEYRCTIKRKTVTVMDDAVEGEDSDVADERQRVLSGGADDDLLRLENLTKIYNSKKTGKHLAVNRLTLGVSKGQCFGLLGVNGAGKTTTFKMLTGDSSVTAGEGFIENRSVVRDLLQLQKLIGYCPQFDALIDHLTAEEHIYLYARLKGIPELEIKELCSWLIKKMALSRYAKKPSRTYSGGNKRKLSAAIALIGNPSIIFMDEPTTGMDPGARRFLWNVILSIIQQGTRSVVLTSHSMEECEALCTRLAIMVNGQFQCIGSTQHIKNRFGDGYIVVVRVKGNQPDMTPVMNFMLEAFEDCILKECHHNFAQFQILSDNISLAQIFAKMEEVCVDLEIEDYSVSQTSLDNVFVNFAKYQTDNTLQNDPSFMQAANSSRMLSLKTRWRKMKRALPSRKRSKNSTELLRIPSEASGSIGENEDEVALEDVDSFSFPEETTRLALNV